MSPLSNRAAFVFGGQASQFCLSYFDSPEKRITYELTILYINDGCKGILLHKNSLFNQE